MRQKEENDKNNQHAGLQSILIRCKGLVGDETLISSNSFNRTKKAAKRILQLTETGFIRFGDWEKTSISLLC